MLDVNERTDDQNGEGRNEFPHNGRRMEIRLINVMKILQKKRGKHIHIGIKY
jgi:hypothetical protein